jgi:hypothetical protein
LVICFGGHFWFLELIFCRTNKKIGIEPFQGNAPKDLRTIAEGDVSKYPRLIKTELMNEAQYLLTLKLTDPNPNDRPSTVSIVKELESMLSIFEPTTKSVLDARDVDEQLSSDPKYAPKENVSK